MLGEIRIDESGMLGFEIGSRVEHHLDGFFAIADNHDSYAKNRWLARTFPKACSLLEPASMTRAFASD